MLKTNQYTDNDLCFLSRHAYEAGEVRLALHTANVWDEHDTGWELLLGTESGLELADPENGLLISISKAIELDAALAPLFFMDAQSEKAAYRKNTQSGHFEAAKFSDRD
ncbi:MAG: DUF2185 domain-containing protein [Ruminococcus sp.]|nr:DUF2185 domain-containing protein [Ruminococcus sp.]